LKGKEKRVAKDQKKCYTCMKIEEKMKKLMAYSVGLFLIMIVLASCNPTEKETLSLSKQKIAFYGQADSDTIEIVCNTAWKVVKNDHSDWYKLSSTSGNKNGRLIISVENYESITNRKGTFTIKTELAEKEETVLIKQNGQSHSKIANTIWGVAFYERWNTDFYGEMIPETYETYTFNPEDTLQGFTMYFFENNSGCQADNKTSGRSYFLFDYEYDESNSNFYISFETNEGSAPEDYNAHVNTLNDTLFVLTNEYKDHWFEKATMSKIGEIETNQKSRMTYPKAKKKQNSAIFEIPED
jgi:hypothetical protein